jgi:hypothetical protein
LDAAWLRTPNFSERFGDYIVEVLAAAARTLDAKGQPNHIHGVILPELALDRARAHELATTLAARTNIELFVTGISDLPVGGSRGRNAVLSYFLSDSRPLASWLQSKHHRWRLDEGQLAAYDFHLDRAYFWWEHIDVSNREVVVYAFRDGATLCTLVCEDLARVEPVQPVVRAIGPNLLIALLLDGPQFMWRWSARYATVLADDPGTSVLTFTSLAPVVRHLAHRGGPDQRHIIGLWKDSANSPRELELRPADAAVLLCLEIEDREERTLDRRTDGTQAKYILARDVLNVELARFQT